jgi:hypothetical protein
MRYYLWIATVLAGAGLAGAGCSSTGSNPGDEPGSASDMRGPVGNGAFGEPVPAQNGEPAPGSQNGGTAAQVQGHGFTGNGAFGEKP